MIQSKYRLPEKLLHGAALAWPAIPQLSFAIESALTSSTLPAEGQHVFVAGLARAGTTVLLNALYSTGKFCSLTYRNMPFVLMPGVWGRIARSFREAGERSERAHGDGIMVDFDSPEALEEVFWRCHCGSDYITPNHLRPHEVEGETLRLYRRYVSKVVASCGDGTTRYLSKNNNNILRLSAISTAFPEACILIPFRDPIQQAASLLRQHTRFCEMHRGDSFSRNYMKWLAHHEFGLTHKPFAFEPGPCAPSELDSTQLSYWIETWCGAYSYLLSNKPANARFVCFERLCQDGAATARTDILEPCQLDVDPTEFAARFVSPEGHPARAAGTALHKRASRLYEELLATCP